MNKDPYICITLVTYKETLQEIINIVKLFTRIKYKKKIILFDNLNQDRSKDFSNLNVDYIKSDKNVGYGSGHNCSLNQNESFDFQIISNIDIDFDIDDIHKLIKSISEDSDIGLISPKIIDINKYTYFNVREFPNIFHLILWKLNSKILNKIFLYEFIDNSKINRPIEANHVSGCFMIVRYDLFKKINGFDKKFFLYLEDTDLCRRIKPFKKIIYNPKFKINHYHQKSHSIKIRYLFLATISSFKYLLKWGFFDLKGYHFNKKLRKEISEIQ